MEINYKTLSGIILAVIIMSGGTVYLLEDAGTKTGCRNGWEYVSSGENEGHFKCVTQAGERFEWCYEVYNSSNTENYWCKRGKLINQSTNFVVGKQYSCSPIECVLIE